MNLLLVSQEYPPETGHGGIATHTQQKARGLASLGHRVLVLSHAGAGGPGERRDGDVRVHRIAGADARLPLRSEPARWIAWSVEVAAAVDGLLQREPFDLVEFVDWGGEGFVWLLNRGERRRPPALVHLQGPMCLLARELDWPPEGSELRRVGTLMESSCLRLADGVLSSSRLSAHACAEAYGLDAEAIPVAHAGVDLQRFHPAPEPPPTSPPLVLFVGRIAASKGADLLVEAALRVAAEFPGLRVRMIGREEGNLASRLAARAAAAGLPRLLELPGPVAHDALPAEYRAATIFCAPSPCEGGPGFVQLEAMASGLPVIGCAETGVAEVIEHEVTGLLVPRGDAAALAAALRALLADPVRAAALGRAARAAVERDSDPQRCVRWLAALYEGACSGRYWPAAK